MPQTLDFSGKAVIVTGGCRGIGRAIAERFLEAGAGVVICCRHQPDTLPGAEGREAAFVMADVRDPDECERVVDVAVEHFDRLDVLVNNAGGAPPAEAATVSPRFSEAVIHLNLLGAMHMAQHANAVMQRQPGGGAIVNIGSISGMRPSPGAAAYGAAKAGVISLTQTLAMEWAPNVRVNCVTPGLVLTDDAEAHYGDERSQQAVAATVPVGRMADPTEIADACLFLASDLSGFTSGANLVLHGGGERPPYLDALDRP